MTCSYFNAVFSIVLSVPYSLLPHQRTQGSANPEIRLFQIYNSTAVTKLDVLSLHIHELHYGPIVENRISRVAYII